MAINNYLIPEIIKKEDSSDNEAISVILEKFLQELGKKIILTENIKDLERIKLEDEINHEVALLQKDLDLTEAINEKPIKLGLFSVRVINAIANSFLGVPAAVIIIAADQLLTGHMLLFMSTPDKIFLLALSAAILITFLILAYKTEAKTANHKEISETIKTLYQLSCLIDIGGKTDYITKIKNEALLEKCIIKIRDKKVTQPNIFDVGTIYHQLLENEINFAINKEDENDYIELYREMHHLREDINYKTNSENQSIIEYIKNYRSIALSEIDRSKEWSLLDTKLSALEKKLTLPTTIKERFSKIGNTVGSINAVVNGILTCSFGIGGITAFIVIFMPGFSIPLAAIIPISIALFLAGTIHSGTITKGFMKNSFENFGTLLEEENTLSPDKDFKGWLKFLFAKAYKYRSSLFLSLVSAIALTTLSVLSVSLFLTAMPIPTAALISIALFVGILTFVACNTSFNSVLMNYEKEQLGYKVLVEKLFTEHEKELYEKSKQTERKHNILSISVAITIAVILFLTLPTNIGMLAPIMIGAVAGGISYSLSALFDSQDIIAAKNPSKDSVNAIMKTRSRIMVSIVFGASFAIAAGPAVAKIIFATLFTTSPAAAFILSIGSGLLIASAIYYVLPLIYWDASLKPINTTSLPGKLFPSASSDPSSAMGPIPTQKNTPGGNVDKSKDQKPYP